MPTEDTPKIPSGLDVAKLLLELEVPFLTGPGPVAGHQHHQRQEARSGRALRRFPRLH